MLCVRDVSDVVTCALKVVLKSNCCRYLLLCVCCRVLVVVVLRLHNWKPITMKRKDQECKSCTDLVLPTHRSCCGKCWT